MKYCYHAEFLDGESVLLLSEKKNTLLSGKLYTLVLSNIQKDGISIEELVERLEGEVSAAEIFYALSILEKEGYITESTPAVSPGVSAYWNSMGMDVNTLLKRLEENPVSVESAGSLSTGAFSRAFGTMGIKTGLDGVLKVIITGDYDRKELRRINGEAMETKQPWMLVKPAGVELWIGPIFVPGKTGCWACLVQRLRNNRPMNTFYKVRRNTGDNPPVPVSLSPASVQVAANLAALEIAKWLYFGKNERLEGKIMSLDTFSFATRSHELVKRPQCEMCGEAGYRNPNPKPVILEKRSSYCISRQGAYREVALEDTIERYRHHVSPITGVVQTLEPYLPEPGSPVHNYSSGYNAALKSKTLLWLNHHIRSVNVGKGKTWSQAKAGALCEAIERYSSCFHGDEPYITGSLKELGGQSIHPNACMNYSEKQYRDREHINRECAKFYFMVPVPFDESLKMHWTPVYSLTRHTFVYLPSCFCYTQYPAEDEQHLFCYPDTNGNAAGNSIEEAILQGFLELVERDGAALWWYNRLRKPAVDLLSFNEAYFTRLMEYYHSLNRSLYVLDLTTDLQISVFAAVSHSLDGNNREILFAFGAHVDARIAIERALLEVNQILPVVNVPEADRAAGRYRTEDKHFLHWLKRATLENQPYLVPLEEVPGKKASHYPALCHPNVYDSVTFCIDTAAEHGLETLVLDMTRPDVELNVVKVIVPGLRHFWKRLAPGRLYDVPVKMGWLKAPLKEEELNPMGIFL
jgi:ribosomal protein S12 methylthiotransferase accessory factor